MSNELNQDLSMSDEDFLNMMPPTFEPPGLVRAFLSFAVNFAIIYAL